jgi:hypothetical protein
MSDLDTVPSCSTYLQNPPRSLGLIQLTLLLFPALLAIWALVLLRDPPWPPLADRVDLIQMCYKNLSACIRVGTDECEHT